MSRAAPSIPTTLRLNPNAPLPTQKQIHISSKLFSPAPILRFTVGKYLQLPPAESPEVVILGRSNIGKSSLLNALFPQAPHNFARVSSKPGHTKTLNGYTTPAMKFTILDLPGYGYRGRVEWAEETLEFLRSRRELKKAYLLLDSLHGPKETDLDMLEELAKTGLSHQLILTKLDRAPATLWTQLFAALKHNPTKGTVFKSATRVLPGHAPSPAMEDLEMGVWRELRGNLGLGCDETVLGISSEMGWGFSALRCSILKACGAFRRDDFGDQQYLRGLRESPIVEDRRDVKGKAVESEARELDDDDEEDEEGRKRKKVVGDLDSRFEDDNPMRGKVFGGKETLRKKIYRW